MKQLSEFKLSKALKRWIFILVVLFSIPFCLARIGLKNRPAEGYDERMWTSTSISTYAMANGHVRPTTKLDNWFAAYAWRHGLSIFTGEKITEFRPDTVHFPYDMVTLAEENNGMTFVVCYDTLAFPRKRFQWFDNSLWTFGWKAPNLGKYIMGWSVGTGAEIDPNGFFKFEDENGNPSTASFAYPPQEAVYRARIPNAVLAAFSIGLVFWLGWQWLGFFPGLLAALLLLLNKDFIAVNTAAGLDSFLSFFSLASLLALTYQIPHLVKNGSFATAWRPAILSGIALGCTVSSKLNGALFFFIAALAFIVLIYYMYAAGNFYRRMPLIFFSGAITVGSGLLVFFLFNPIVRQQPLATVSTIRESVDDYFEKRAKILLINRVEKRVQELASAAEQNVQAGILGPETAQAVINALSSQMQFLAAEEQANRLPQKVDKSWREIIRQQEVLEKAGVENLSPDKHFYNWVKIKNELPEAFTLVWQRLFVRMPDAPAYYGTLGNRLPFAYNFLDLLFFLIGILSILRLLYARMRNFEPAFPLVLFLVSTAFVGYGNTQFLWNDWSRYFTPMLPFMAIGMGMGITVIGNWIWKKISGAA